MYGCESWTKKKAECRRIDAFELWCWRRLLSLAPPSPCPIPPSSLTSSCSAAHPDCIPRDAWGLVAAQVGRGTLNNEDAVGWVKESLGRDSRNTYTSREAQGSSQDGITPLQRDVMDEWVLA